MVVNCQPVYESSSLMDVSASVYLRVLSAIATNKLTDFACSNDLHPEKYYKVLMKDGVFLLMTRFTKDGSTVRQVLSVNKRLYKAYLNLDPI